MAVTKKFGVEGLEGLQKALKEFDDDIIKKSVRIAARDAMKPVAERAKSMVPVDKGNLKETIKVSSGTSRGKYDDRIGWAAVKAGGKGKKDSEGRMPGEYVLSMHYGNFKDEEEPFLLDAFEPHAQSIVNDFAKELRTQTKKGVKTMARRNNKRGK